MQLLKHTTNLIHPLLSEIERLYTALSSENDSGSSLIENSYDLSLLPLQELFNEYTSSQHYFNFTNKNYSKLDLPVYTEKNIIVCFSGGKDSLATALYYKDHGYNVYLYNLQGINKCYPKESERAEKLAEQLGMTYIQEKVTLSGNHDYIEHPMKNMVIANMALSYGISHNIGTDIAFGNYTTSSIYNDPFDVCGGDDVEMWEIYDKIIQTIIPHFKIHIVLDNVQDSMKCLKCHKDLIPYVSSCIGTFRFTGYYRRQNENKYNIKLLPNRCGSCWKCAYEYIYLVNHKVQEKNEGYYKHCLDVLRNTIKREQGRNISPEEVIDEYFFYDKNKFINV